MSKHNFLTVYGKVTERNILQVGNLRYLIINGEMYLNSSGFFLIKQIDGVYYDILKLVK